MEKERIANHGRLIYYDDNEPTYKWSVVKDGLVLFIPDPQSGQGQGR